MNPSQGWLLLLLVPLLVPAGFGIVLGIQFLAGALLGDRHWRGIGAAWLGEVGASMRTFLVAIPFFGRRALRSTAGEHAPVVLVHGYFCNRAVWRPFFRHLAAAGHPVEAIDLKPTFTSIDQHAPTIGRAVAAAARGGRPVVLVGHSMGGLAIRAYLRAAGHAGVAGVITLGSPHRGTRAAALGLSRSARQMRRDSEWLAALAAHEREAGLPPCSIILTANDNMVYPQGEQVLAEARVRRLDGVGHLDLVYEPLVWRLVEEEIGRIEARGAGSAAEDARAVAS